MRVTTTVVALDGGKETWRSEQVTRADQFDAAKETTHRVQLPLRELAPGGYRLRVTAAAGDVTTTRELDFRVRAAE